MRREPAHDIHTVDHSLTLDSDASGSNPGRSVDFRRHRQTRTFDLTNQQWHGEPLRFDSELLLATPMQEALLTVEKSGRVQKVSFRSETSQPPEEFHGAPLSAATFSPQPRRLALATEDGRVMFYRVP